MKLLTTLALTCSLFAFTSCSSISHGNHSCCGKSSPQCKDGCKPDKSCCDDKCNKCDGKSSCTDGSCELPKKK